MNILLPPGIGDSIWAMVKIQSLIANLNSKCGSSQDINILISGRKSTYPYFQFTGNVRADIDKRSLDYLRRFSFVKSVELRAVPILANPVTTPEGYNNYVPDGPGTWKPPLCQTCAYQKTPCRYHIHDSIDYIMMPNAHLERGRRLEDWLPEFECNWNIMDEYEFRTGEFKFGENFKNKHGEYIIIYMCSLIGNGLVKSQDGCHNRNTIWTPEEWVELGRKLHEIHGVKIAVIGAVYDNDYWTQAIAPLLTDDDNKFWINMIEKTTTGEAFSLGKNARYCVSYQGGITMVPVYMGTPAAIFWRQKGDSIFPDKYLSFEESMATAWVPPKMLEEEKFLPLYYGRHDVNYIVDEIKRRKW